MFARILRREHVLFPGHDKCACENKITYVNTPFRYPKSSRQIRIHHKFICVKGIMQTTDPTALIGPERFVTAGQSEYVLKLSHRCKARTKGFPETG